MEKEACELKIKELIDFNLKALEYFKNGNYYPLTSDDLHDVKSVNTITAVLICEILKNISENDAEAMSIAEAARMLYYDKYWNDKILVKPICIKKK